MYMRKNDMAKALLFHLTHTYKVPTEKGCSLDEIECALKEMLDEGASLVVASINSELEQEMK